MGATRELRRESPSFHTLDFGRLWRGRERTTEVERGLLALALDGPGRFPRLLEVGCGNGRLSPTVQWAASEYVAFDLTREFVAQVPALPGRPIARAVGDVRYLPFGDETFDAAVMVRMYNFLPDPEPALKELRRILKPGGTLILSVHPRPSVATLFDDVRSGVTRVPGAEFHPTTFGAEPVARATNVEFPTWLPSADHFAGSLRKSGFRIQGQWACGLEDYRLLRWLPARTFIGLSNAAGRFPWFPMRLVKAEKPG